MCTDYYNNLSRTRDVYHTLFIIYKIYKTYPVIKYLFIIISDVYEIIFITILSL